jgi:protein ImuA
MSQAVNLAALYDRIRRIERPARHGVLPFDVAAIDQALPGGGLALGAVHEILGADGDEEDGAAASGFAAGILARLDAGPAPTSPSHRGAMGPSLSPLKGGEGKPRRRNNSLSAPEGGEGPLPNPPPQAGEGSVGAGGREGRGEVGDSRALGSGPVLWCLKRPDLYGPGLAAHGLDPARLVIVAAPRDAEILWAIEEGLRMPGLAAVVGEIGRLPMVAGRRLQLAAERSGITALLLRRWRNGGEAAAERERPSAALTRWRVMALSSRDIPLQRNPLPPVGGEGRVRGAGEAHPFLLPSPQSSPPASEGRGGNNWIGSPRWRVELLRCRSGVPALWDVEVADASGHVSVSAGLADRSAAPPRRSSEPPLRHFG